MQGSRPVVTAPKPSQIPGLGDHNDDVNTAESRRPSVRDTDSAYVRLAKQGGQKHLLSMEPDVSQDSSSFDASRQKSAAQQRPDWFYDNSGYHGDESQHTDEQYQRSALQ